MDRLLVASEYTDPALYEEETRQRLITEWQRGGNTDPEKRYRVGLLLISKMVYQCAKILDNAKTLDIPTVIHSTNTGLAQSVLEPMLPLGWRDGLLDSLKVWKSQYPEAKFVLRLDPIIPYHTSEAVIYSMIELAAVHGVKDVRFSIMDCYPFVRKRFQASNLSVPSSFEFSTAEITTWSDRLAGWASAFGMTVNSCAEPSAMTLNWGCTSHGEWLGFGFDLERTVYKQRKHCTCTVKKYDLLKGMPCSNNCMYCYYSKGGKQ